MRSLRFCIIFMILPYLLCFCSLPAYSKIRLKIPIKLKFPENFKLTTGAQPVPGSQDASITMHRVSGKKGQEVPSILGKKASVEPVSWKCEETNPIPEAPAVTEEKRANATELSFSPVDGSPANERNTPASEEKEPSQKAVRQYKVVDFSKVVQSEPSIPRHSCDVSYIPGLVDKINDDMFNHYRNSARIISIINLPSLKSDSPSYDPREDGIIITYKGFQMTKKAARCFAKLEELIGQNFPGRRIIITSTTGGKHLDPKHYEGNAIDFVVEGLSRSESILVESLSRQADFMPYNEYIKSSPYKTGDHMHVDVR